MSVLRCCRAAITPGSRLLVFEMLVPPGNDPSHAKLLDLMMLVRAEGRERSEAEYAAVLQTARLRLVRSLPTATSLSVLEAHPE